jgi:calcium-binding protein CML
LASSLLQVAALGSSDRVTFSRFVNLFAVFYIFVGGVSLFCGFLVLFWKLATMKLGGSKAKRQASGNLTVETNGLPLASLKPVVAESPKVAKTPKTPKTPNGEKSGFMAWMTNSLRKTKSNSEKMKNGESVPVALPISKPMEELRRAFRVYDSDNDGRISTSEVRTVLTSLGGAISDEELNLLMKQIDTDNDGFISFDEFVEFHRATSGALPDGEISPVHDPMRDAFQMFDKDGDRRISATELQSVLVSLGDRGHSLEECKHMIESVDKDGDGYVDFLEFQELMGGPD